jgi:hypothetical protein
MWKTAKPALAVFAALSVFALIACGRPLNDPPQNQVPVIGGDAAADGAGIPASMSDAVKANLGGKSVENCDSAAAANMKAIATALDTNAAAIDAFAAANAPTSTDVTAGNLTFEDFQRPAPAAGWTETQLGWSDAKALFDKVTGTSASADWLDLRSKVKTLLKNDRNRAVLSRNMALTKDSLASLAKADKAARACGQDPNCEDPGIDQDFVSANPIYGGLTDWIRRMNTHGGKRAYLTTLIKRLDYDKYVVYDFHPNPTVIRDSATTLKIPFNAGTLPDDLSKVLQTGWTGGSIAVNPFFAQPNPVYYTVEVAASPGASFTDNNKKLLHLAPKMDVKMIAHEMGHLLGFRDRRYDVWNGKTCAYTIQTRAEDLMSVPETGSVLPEDLTTLDQAYPKK